MRAAGPLPGAAVGAARRAATWRRARQPSRSGSAESASSLARGGGRQPPGLTAVQPLPAQQHARGLQQDARRRGAATSARCTRGRARSARATGARRGRCTCAQPVMPGSTARRPSWRGVYWATCDAHGRARADEAHVARQHVDEVRQLVEREPPQQRARARDARVALVDRQPGSHLLRAAHHRAQLQQVELAAALAHAALAVDRRRRGSRAGSPRMRARAAAPRAGAAAPRATTSSARLTARGRGGRGSGGIAAIALPPAPRSPACRAAASPTGRPPATRSSARSSGTARAARRPRRPISAPASSASCAAERHDVDRAARRAAPGWCRTRSRAGTASRSAARGARRSRARRAARSRAGRAARRRSTAGQAWLIMRRLRAELALERRRPAAPSRAPPARTRRATRASPG